MLPVMERVKMTAVMQEINWEPSSPNSLALSLSRSFNTHTNTHTLPLVGHHEVTDPCTLGRRTVPFSLQSFFSLSQSRELTLSSKSVSSLFFLPSFLFSFYHSSWSSTIPLSATNLWGFYFVKVFLLLHEHVFTFKGHIFFFKWGIHCVLMRISWSC